MSLLLSSLSDLVAQQLSKEKLDSLEQVAMACNHSGLEATEMVLAHYHLTGASLPKERSYITKSIACATELGSNDHLSNAYFSLMMYHRYYSPLDSFTVATELLTNLALQDTSLVVRRNAARTLLLTGDYYYFQLDEVQTAYKYYVQSIDCLLYTSPSPRDGLLSRMPSSA